MTKIEPHYCHQHVIITSAADDLLSLRLCVCVYFYISLCRSVLLVVLLSHLLLLQRMQTQVWNHTNTYTQTIWKKNGFSRNQAKAQVPPSQPACLLVIARGIGSPLKRLRACVHVFKRQCYVSACHLGALALRFSPTLTPFLSFSLSQWYKSTVKGLTGQGLAGSFVSPWESSLTVKKALVNYWYFIDL